MGFIIRCLFISITNIYKFYQFCINHILYFYIFHFLEYEKIIVYYWYQKNVYNRRNKIMQMNAHFHAYKLLEINIKRNFTLMLISFKRCTI